MHFYLDSREEKKRLEELRKKTEGRKKTISILRGISIRMPLLIYGAELTDEKKGVTLDNFTTLVDDRLWEEFMPKDVTKDVFNNFKKYYDRDVFASAGKRIRSLARSADKLPIEERMERIADIFATLRNPDKETVLTPWRTVNMHMGDTLGGYCFFDEKYENRIEEPRYIDHGEITDEVFALDTYLLEINSKSGLYPLYLAYNVYRRRLKELTTSPQTLEEHLKVWDRAVAENIFVICMSPMAKSITRRTLVGFRNAKVNTRYFEDLVNQLREKPDNFLSKVVKGKTYWKANNNENMKIKAIVGNPPYQETTERTSDAPVYNYFMDATFNLSDKVTLITPGRYLFNAGKTPSEWNKKILNDEHFKVVWYKPKSTDVFPNVDIKGGVAVMYRDAKRTFGKIGIYTQYKELTSILNKVMSDGKFQTFKKLIYSTDSYKFTSLIHKEHPEVATLLGAGHLYDLTTNVFEKIPQCFFEEKPDDGHKYIQIYGRRKAERVCLWIRKDYVAQHENLDFYKVFVPKSNGTGAIGEILSTPVIGLPVIGHTQTFISIGKFETEYEGEACLKYVKTKFARTMLGTLKITQHNSADTWANVPLQDFTDKSDIDWSQSVADIDRQLYKKYGLSEEERQFIETMIKPM